MTPCRVVPDPEGLTPTITPPQCAGAPRRSTSARCLVVQRSAAERRKAGAEDHAGVDEIGVLDDALVAARFCASTIKRLDQLAAEPLHLALVDGSGRVFSACRPSRRRSPSPVFLPSLPLATSRSSLRPVAPHLQDLADVGAHVEPDRVGQLDRPHRHAECARRFVDLFLGLAFARPAAWPPSCRARARG